MQAEVVKKGSKPGKPTKASKTSKAALEAKWEKGGKAAKGAAKEAKESKPTYELQKVLKMTDQQFCEALDCDLADYTKFKKEWKVSKPPIQTQLEFVELRCANQ